MKQGDDRGPDDSIADIFGDLIEDGEQLLRAEARLYRRIARYRLGRAGSALAALATAALLSLAATIAFFVSLVLGLAPLIGPVLGGVVVLLVSGVAAALLGRWGIARLTRLGDDPDERAALAAGKRGA